MSESQSSTPSPDEKPPSVQGPEVDAPYSRLAIIAFVMAFVMSFVGGILGLVALSQIARTHERGRGLAIAAIVVGFASLVLYVVMILLGLAFAGALRSDFGDF
ncbi:DUF4190 domain-containing protein [Paramicrobacterium sp. CJ85]|uniref:DUF4190 domain-containing protein n=1 Tax=Paramicrobacterium sp. CJ85 TaxID=3445355 RepID=UPI003F5DBA40